MTTILTQDINLDIDEFGLVRISFRFPPFLPNKKINYDIPEMKTKSRLGFKRKGQIL